MSDKTSDYLELLKDCLSGVIYKESAWELVDPAKRKFIRKWLVGQLAKRNYLLVKRNEYDPEVREGGKNWPLFGYTLVGRRRLDNIQSCLEEIIREKVPGDLIETGVWRGGSTILMKAVLKHYGVTDRSVWVADSFEGLPKPKAEVYDYTAGADLSEREFMKVSLEEVKSNFARFGLLDDGVKFLKGWFCDTLSKAPINKLSLLRLDGDLYESTMDSLTALYSRVSPGGYTIIDDYNSWPSCKAAVEDFRGKNSIKEAIQAIDTHGVFWKVT